MYHWVTAKNPAGAEQRPSWGRSGCVNTTGLSVTAFGELALLQLDVEAVNSRDQVSGNQAVGSYLPTLLQAVDELVEAIVFGLVADSRQHGATCAMVPAIFRLSDRSGRDCWDETCLVPLAPPYLQRRVAEEYMRRELMDCLAEGREEQIGMFVLIRVGEDDVFADIKEWRR